MKPLPEKPAVPIEYRSPFQERNGPSASEVFSGLLCALLGVAGVVLGITLSLMSILLRSAGPLITACLSLFGGVVMLRAAGRLFRGRE